MLARYIVTSRKLPGANKLAAEQPSLALASIAEPRVTATITADPEPHFLHIDKAGALATQLLKALFAPEEEGSPEERLAAEIEAVKARRARQTGDGVFLSSRGNGISPRKRRPPEVALGGDARAPGLVSAEGPSHACLQL